MLQNACGSHDDTGFAAVARARQDARIVLLLVMLSVLNVACEPLGPTFHATSQYSSSSAAPRTIKIENAKPGDPDWVLTNTADFHEIEGYASLTSVNRGEDINLYVNTADPSFTIEIFRMGWYGGAGARKMLGPILRAGMKQPPPTFDRRTGFVECDWRDPYLLHIPGGPDHSEWPSGIYIAKLHALTSGKQSYIIFVVRDDERASDLLFQSSVTTYQAYNAWGGWSLYANSASKRATHVSFNRPYRSWPGSAGDFLGRPSHWEYNMVRFLEREGYDVTYSTDIDTHTQGNLLLMHKAFLSVGHDEYWTWEMRDNVENARNHGVSLGFFGADAAYWQVRLEPSRSTGAANRTMVSYKIARTDPLERSTDPALARRVTVLFRNWRVGRPEDAMIGVAFESAPAAGDIVIEDASNWVFQGTGLRNGDHLHGLLGYEADRMYGHAPDGTTRIAHSPYTANKKRYYSDMTVYSPEVGPIVFATGSMSWNWGLDDYTTPDSGGRALTNPAAQQITRNVLSRFGANPD